MDGDREVHRSGVRLQGLEAGGPGTCPTGAQESCDRPDVLGFAGRKLPNHLPPKRKEGPEEESISIERVEETSHLHVNDCPFIFNRCLSARLHPRFLLCPRA